MPRLFTSGAYGSMRSVYRSAIKNIQADYSYDAPAQPNYTSYIYTPPTAETDIVQTDIPMDKQTAIFLDSLATKLLQLTESFEAKIEEAKLTYKPSEADMEKRIFASVETPVMNVSIGYEYFLYVQRYGPPHLGKFDPEKLALIRAEENIEAPS